MSRAQLSHKTPHHDRQVYEFLFKNIFLSQYSQHSDLLVLNFFNEPDWNSVPEGLHIVSPRGKNGELFFEKLRIIPKSCSRKKFHGKPNLLHQM